jgi:glycosyltransferase involved in cell wall biosynthesis
MAETVAVLICSYGSRQVWNGYAARALSSVALQSRGPDEVIRIHRSSLHAARNEAAEMAKTDWICYLDCDDELEPKYLEACLNATGDIRYPRVRYCTEGSRQIPNPVTLNAKPLTEGNFMVVSSLMRREQFLKVGGFPSCQVYEDWILYLKLTYAGSIPHLVGDAVLRAWQRPDGRNHCENPVLQFYSCLDVFRKWCYEFDGGKTTNPQYQEFLENGSGHD